MGTNYYVKDGKVCEECGGSGLNDIHIGKSSMGWQFIFNPFKKSYKEWKLFLLAPKMKIINEYHEEISSYDFCKMVEQKQFKDSTHFKDKQEEDSNEVRDSDGFRISKHEDWT